MCCLMLACSAGQCSFSPCIVPAPYHADGPTCPDGWNPVSTVAECLAFSAAINATYEPTSHSEFEPGQVCVLDRPKRSTNVGDLDASRNYNDLMNEFFPLIVCSDS